MKRSVALALGVSSLLVAGFTFGPGDVRAGDEEGEKKVERRVTIIRHGGGAFLGVGLEEVEGESRGAKVRSVEAESAAEKAGIEEGDVITSFDGVAVRSAKQLARLVAETPAGRSVPIEVKRDGGTQKLTATLGEGRHHRLRVGGEEVEDFEVEIPEPLPVPPVPHGPMPHVFEWHGDDDRDFMLSWPPRRPRLGVRYTEMGRQLADYFGLATDEGVLVTSVDEDSPAADAGIKAGDVILEFDGETITDGRALRRQVGRAEGGEALTVKVQRDGKPLELKVTLAKPEKTRRPTAGVSL